MSGTTSFYPSLSPDALETYLTRMLSTTFPDDSPVDAEVRAALGEALERTAACFGQIKRKYYNVDGRVEFNHLNSDHMSAFLYLVGNTVYRRGGDPSVSAKLFYLNKMMNGLDLYYSVALPEVFLLVHPVGSVIGNATYGNHLTVYQGCTVGADKGVYPTFGDGVVLFSGVSVLGNSRIGDNVVFAANSFVINSPVASNSIVTGSYPNVVVKPASKSVIARIFDSESPQE